VTEQRTGTAEGVPYLAVSPPEGTENPGLVAILHGLDHPHSEETMAATLPLQDVPAWRVYLGLPMSGRRASEGGSEEIMRRAQADALMNVQAPVMEQAAGELPGAIDDLRRQLGLNEDAKVALVGTSAGAGAILKALADSDVQVEAIALINPVSTARAAIEAGERVFGTEYRWTGESTAKADELDFIRRAGEVASGDRQPAILILQGEDDDEAFVRSSEDLERALSKEYRNSDHVSLTMVKGLAHSLGAAADVEPIEREPSNTAATFVDHEVRGLLARHLV
jgi:pimeloyl-ACP methyl ester carboxylesterase